MANENRQELQMEIVKHKMVRGGWLTLAAHKREEDEQSPNRRVGYLGISKKERMVGRRYLSASGKREAGIANPRDALFFLLRASVFL